MLTDLACCPKLPWGHVTVLLDSFPDRETAEFYARRAADECWSRAALRSMIANRLRERSQPALTTFDSSVPDADRESLRELVKDPFILDFLAADPVKERDLSNALIANISKFLRELGVGWAFVGAEVPIQCSDSEYRLDLLFYHCKLHRYVVIELKLGHFEPEHVGQVNFYVQLVDDKLRDHTVDQATLGILLVVGRDDVTVEVALRGISTPLAVSEWRRLPPEVRCALPTAKDLTETVTCTVREIESAALPRETARLADQTGKVSMTPWAALSSSSGSAPVACCRVQPRFRSSVYRERCAPRTTSALVVFGVAAVATVRRTSTLTIWCGRQ